MLGHIGNYKIGGLYSKEIIKRELHTGTFESVGSTYFNGITPAKEQVEEKDNVAESIMLNWKYPNEIFDSELIIYIGEGGMDAKRSRYVKDQKRVTIYNARNQSLINSFEKNTLIRVIIGPNFTHSSYKGSHNGEYLYLGVFRVIKFIQEKSSKTDGFLVFKFYLEKDRNYL